MPGVDYGDKIVGMIDGEKREFAKGALSPEVQQKIIAKMGGVEKAPTGSVDVSLQDVKDFSQNVGDTMGNTVTDALNPWKLSGRILDAGKATVPVLKDAAFAGANYIKNTLGYDTKGDEMDRVSGMGQRATLTPQAQAELANPGSQPEMQPEQQSVPEYLARPGTPQAMVQNAIQGQTPQSGESMRISAQRPTGTPASYSGGLMGEMGKAFNAEKDANLLAARVGQRKAAEQAGYEQEKLRLMQQQAAQQATFEDRAKTERDTQLAKVTALNDKLKAIDTTINPDHFWANKGTGSKVTAALAVFLGGLGGGENRALGILQNAISQDIDAQRATAQLALEKGQKAIDAQQSIYSQYLRNIGDDRAAMLASQVSALGIVQQRIGAMGAKYAAPEMQAKLQAANAAVDQQAAKAKSELATRLDQLSIQRAELSMKRDAVAAERAQKDAKDPALYVPGVGLALDAKSKEKVQEQAAGYNATNGILRQMIALRKANGGETLPTGAKRTMNSLVSQFKINYSKMVGGGSMDEGMSKMVDQIVGGDVNSYFGGEDEALNALSATLKDSFRERTEPYMAQRMDAASQLGIRPR